MTEEIKSGQTQTQNPDEWLSGWMHQILYVTMRGIFVAVPHFKLEKIILLTCMSVARIVAETYAGDEVSVRRLRKGCRDIFAETLNKMPVVGLNAPVNKTDTAAIGS